MRKISINFLLPLSALVILIAALSQQLFNIPPLGKLLDPFTGAVQNGEDKRLSERELVINGMGLRGPVNVFFDKRKVPHIYATHTEDLYFAQGYVTACLRLWQMDFVSYAAAGRLSEILGDKMLDHDRNQRRIGLPEAARRSLKLIEQDPTTIRILNAYTSGVNAYIRQLSYKNMPLEYKLLDYRPEPWTNLKSVLIMKSMANTLSGYEEDVMMSKLMLALGEEKFNQLYPGFTSRVTPVTTGEGTRSNHYLAYTSKPAYLDYSFLTSGTANPGSSYNPNLGSNSWAVSGKRTRSGFPILCNDPHLNLSLPAIWIEMQLAGPDVNVYGVSIPGTPAVIIGFNKHIAWGLTNGADDVKDWYKLTITGDYKQYRIDGRWKDLDYTIETIKRKGARPFYDTIYHTIQGPVVADRSFSGRYPELKNFSLKWQLHNPSNEFRAFIELNKASNYDEYAAAIRYYSCPVQNFTFACKDNTIAINHQGRLPLKWPGQGRFMLDGALSSHDYNNYIPQDSLPHMVNPSCGYVLSANQHPTPGNYAYYYNGYYSENRANRIREMLDSRNKVDIGDMKAMQLDNTSFFAEQALPILLEKVNTEKLNGLQQKRLTGLRKWNAAFDAGSEDAALFHIWWKNIETNVWDEFRSFSFAPKTPNADVLLDLIQCEPDNGYFDNQSTTEKEDASAIINKAFVDAVDEYEKAGKKKDMRWASLNKVNIMHLTNLPAFSRMGIQSAGYPAAVNAISSNWGPSWRMIVELGDRPNAFGIYAGGQSGNIGSPYYDNFISDWNKGNYYQLIFFLSINEARSQTANSWLLR